MKTPVRAAIVAATRALLQRAAGHGRSERRRIAFTLDGATCTGHEGDTVLTAVLACSARLRASDVSGEPRAGLCLMGACQDCWMACSDGSRVRACTTPLAEGMQLVTGAAP